MLPHRVLGCALASALVMVPVQASAKDASFAKVIADLNDPQRQDAMAGALEALSAAVLDVKVAPFLKALDRAAPRDGAREIDPAATLADVAGPGARQMPRELGNQVPLMMGMMGTMAGELAAMAPQLEAMGRRLEGAVERSAERSRRRRRD